MSCSPTIGVARELHRPYRRPSPRQPGLEFAGRGPPISGRPGGCRGRPGGALPARRLPVRRLARRPGRVGLGRRSTSCWKGRACSSSSIPMTCARDWEMTADDTRRADGRVPARARRRPRSPPPPNGGRARDAGPGGADSVRGRSSPGPSRWAPTWAWAREGSLIAMAGERLHPAGWTEISAVCTDAAFRGQGIGTRLVRAIAMGDQGPG